MKRKVLCTLATLTLTRLTLSACWMMIPLEEVVKQNPVVVRGTIVEVKVNPGPEREGQLQDTAFIQVDAVLKNTLKDQTIAVGDRLPLSFPSANRKMMISTDISFNKGQSGIWILEFRDGAFHATYPGDFQEKDQEEQVRNLIGKN